MYFQRLLLFVIFSLSSLLLWESWQAYQHPERYQSEQTNLKNGDDPLLGHQDGIQKSNTGVITQGKTVLIETDTLRAEINTVGGVLQKVQLLKHFETKNKDVPITLLNHNNEHIYVAESGLLGKGLPTHKDEFQLDSDSVHYKLSEGKDTLEVKLSWNNEKVWVHKIYTFQRGSYLIDVKYLIDNQGTEEIPLSAYYQLVRDDSLPKEDSKLLPTYTGPAIYTEKDKLRKISFESIAQNKATTEQSKDGWIAILQHYFVVAWLPQFNIGREFYTKKLRENIYAAGVLLNPQVVSGRDQIEITTRLYIGPTHSDLDDIAPGLGLTVDYGLLTVIAAPLFAALKFFHGLAMNWGVAIILLTVLIKLLFFPLSAASYRSMAKLRVVAPKLERIKQQYGDDREKLNRAMMDLYKTEKINPLGGCLPILIQIPVFIALYWAILSSVELRNAPFFGWIDDLSAADPYFILPIVMGISMWAQSKLNPTPTDPLQAKLMQIMPIMFSIVFFFLPAGLVLYSIVNNLLSIGQQWYITRKLTDDAAPASA